MAWTNPRGLRRCEVTFCSVGGALHDLVKEYLDAKWGLSECGHEAEFVDVVVVGLGNFPPQLDTESFKRRAADRLVIFLSLNKEKDSDVLLGGVQEKWKRDATSILASMGEAAPACIFLRSADMAPALATTSPLKILSVVVCVLAVCCLLGFLGAFVVPGLKTFVLPTDIVVHPGLPEADAHRIGNLTIAVEQANNRTQAVQMMLNESMSSAMDRVDNFEILVNNTVVTRLDTLEGAVAAGAGTAAGAVKDLRGDVDARFNSTDSAIRSVSSQVRAIIIENAIMHANLSEIDRSLGQLSSHVVANFEAHSKALATLNAKADAVTVALGHVLKVLDSLQGACPAPSSSPKARPAPALSAGFIEASLTHLSTFFSGLFVGPSTQEL